MGLHLENEFVKTPTIISNNPVLQCYNLMGPPSYVRSVVDRNVVMRRKPVFLLRHSRAVSQSIEKPAYILTDGETKKLLHYEAGIVLIRNKKTKFNKDRPTDVTCLFFAQHVSNASTFIFRSL